MSLALSPHPNAVQAIRPRTANGRVTRGRVAFMLVYRLVGFAAVQGLIAAVFALRGAADPWAASVAWWPVSAIVVSVANLALLVALTRREGLRYVDLLAFDRTTAGRDVLIALGLTLLAAPLAVGPIYLLSTVLFADPMTPSNLLFQPLPRAVAAAALLLFPLTIALSELPNYFGYAMPRLEALGARGWLAVAAPVFFLAAQHATLPLVFDWRFMAYRLGTFALFALLLGVVLHWRPRLMPYLMVGHFLIDLSTAWMIWQA